MSTKTLGIRGRNPQENGKYHQQRENKQREKIRRGKHFLTRRKADKGPDFSMSPPYNPQSVHQKVMHWRIRKKS
jgi:hypothetical protein